MARPRRTVREQKAATRAQARAALAVRKAREAAGMSQRELGRRAGTSWVTVRSVEQGHDPSCSTLAAFRAVLPDLRPEALFPEVGARMPRMTASLWRYLARVHGFCASRVSQRVSHRRDGASRTVVRVENLRATDAPMSAPETLEGLVKAAWLGLSATLRSIELTDSELARRRLRIADATGTHEFSLPRGEGGITYVYKGAPRPADDARRSAFAVGYPILELELSVRLPRSDAPRTFAAFAAPLAVIGADATELLRSPSAESRSVLVDPERGIATLRVAHAAPELQYGLTWE